MQAKPPGSSEFLALELPEAQASALVCRAVVFSLLGMLLLLQAALCVLPPERCLYGLAVAAVVSRYHSQKPDPQQPDMPP